MSEQSISIPPSQLVPANPDGSKPEIVEFPDNWPNVHFTDVGLIFDGSVDHDTWLKVGRYVCGINRRSKLWIADWLLENDRSDWGHSYDEIIALTGLEYETLRSYASVGRAVAHANRIAGSRISWYAAVAPLAAHEQLAVLRQALKDGWDREMIRERVKELRSGKDIDPDDPPPFPFEDDDTSFADDMEMTANLVPAQDTDTHELVVRAQQVDTPAGLVDASTGEIIASAHTLSVSSGKSGETPAGVAEYELYTPEWLINRARLALGGEIDLDPASCKEAQEVVRANRFFDIEADGLSRPWVTTSAWINSPYGNGYNKPWAEKIIQEFMGGGMMKGLVLQQAAVGAPWFQMFADFPRCHLSQRVAFWGPADKGFGPRFDSVIFALGVPLDAFAEAFEDVGHIYIRYTRGTNGNH